MKKGSRIQILFLAVILSVAWCMPVSAEESAGAQKDWEFQLAPFYLWGWTITGDTTIGTPLGSQTVEVDVSLGDLVDGIQGAFVANFQGLYKNKWGFLVDYNYLRIAGDDTQGPAYLDLNMKMQLFQVNGLYRITPAQRHALDIMAGARYIGMDPNVKIYTPRKLNEAGGDQDWVDPIVGLRWVWDLADQWRLSLAGDIGGFGVGSDFTWQGVGLITWKPFEHVSFSGGYRALYIDYDDGSRYTPNYFSYDTTMHGPLLGVSFHW